LRLPRPDVKDSFTPSKEDILNYQHQLDEGRTHKGSLIIGERGTLCLKGLALVRKQDLHFPSDMQMSWVRIDTQRNMLSGLPNSASCVQKFDDSLNSAIRITYRISLRSSSLREPRYPLLRVVL
jgi:hypothetical protein